MQLHTVLDKAFTETATVVRGVKPDHLEAPTPCGDWDVRDLINHLLQVGCALSLAGRQQPVPTHLWDRDLVMDGEWTSRFDDEARVATTAWAQPDSWRATVTMGDVSMPAPMAATMFISDLAIHGWDLAQGTGQSYRCDDDVAQVTLQAIQDMGEQGRQMGIFAAPLATYDGAPPFSRALALSGRDPQWIDAA